MKKTILLFCLILSIHLKGITQVPIYTGYGGSAQDPGEAAAPDNLGKKGGSTGPIFDTTKWTARIDSTWGFGVSTAEKLQLFDTFWNTIDSSYPCFINLPDYNWDSLTAAMRAEIAGGVSKGRFAAIMGVLIATLSDVHTAFSDQTIIAQTRYPGVPVFRGGTSTSFGACMTTVNDSEAVVYEAVPNHPFGLQRGDVIWGYNNVPWTQLIDIILRHQVPNISGVKSAPAATRHNYIRSAPYNWHLFNTIIIKKCNGVFEKYPTSLMEGKDYAMLCQEAMPLDGIHQLTYNEYYSTGTPISQGMIAGSRIGYLTMIDCNDNSGDTMYTHVKSLVEDSLCTGLIIDIRTNYGGRFNAFTKTFQYLNAGNVSWVGFGERSNPKNHFAMAVTGNPSTFDVSDADPTSFDKPIAILVGPNAVSAGDFLQVLFRYHPHVKTFGKSTGGAFGNFKTIVLPVAGYTATKQSNNYFSVSAPGTYLSHLDFPVDFPVWFNKDSICNGADNIVLTAVNWIKGETGLDKINRGFDGIQIYPNPAGASLFINADPDKALSTTIDIIDLKGSTIQSNRVIFEGGKAVKIDISNLAAAMYLVMINGKGYRFVKYPE